MRLVPPPDGVADPPAELKPRAGELLMKSSSRHRKVHPWAVDVDNPRAALSKLLRLLFENEELYGSPLQSTTRLFSGSHSE